MRRLSLLSSLAAVALLTAACGGNVNRDSAPAKPLAFEDDSANCVALLHDDGGTMDSLFRAKGYVWGEDIVRAAKDGSTDAQYLLAQMYAYGIAGARPNRREAFKLYISLADNGVAEAQTMAGYMFLYGYGVEADEARGLEMIAGAANAGSGLAYLLLGNFYSQAGSPAQNMPLAKACYAEAKALGVAEAEAMLDGVK